MKTIKLYCKKCNVALTNDLLEISNSKICWIDNQNSIPFNHFTYPENEEKKNIIVAIDTYFLKDNPNHKNQGCCGNSNEKSYNKLCANGHEVATKIDDCWSGFYIEFDSEKIILKEKGKDGYPYAK